MLLHPHVSFSQGADKPSHMLWAASCQKRVSGIEIRPLFGSRACAAMTDSSSDLSRTGAAIAKCGDVGSGLFGSRTLSQDLGLLLCKMIVGPYSAGGNLLI